MTIGTISWPANQVANGESEPIFASLLPPVNTASSVANDASLPVENFIHYSNRNSSSMQFHPPPFIPGYPQFRVGHRVPPLPVPPFGGYSGFHGPATLPRPLSYNYTASPPMKYSQRRTPSQRPPLGAPPGLFFSCSDPQLTHNIVTQIDYYFSYDNLVKDTYLRQNMDDCGWVSIGLIANFNKVKQLTGDIPTILYALRTSSVVEVWGDKVRRRDDWKRWVLPATTVFPRGRFGNQRQLESI